MNISDHAVLRYLERAYGLDIGAIRDEIANIPGLAEAMKLKALRYSKQGFTFQIKNDAVVTVQSAQSGQAAHRGAVKNKFGGSVRSRSGAQNRGNHAPATRSWKRSKRPHKAVDVEQEIEHG